jgi:transcriptional antiterminator RfaH
MSLSRWHLLQTKPYQEARTLETLRSHQYICFLPIHRCKKVRSGIQELIGEPLFSRYLFVQLGHVESEAAELQRLNGVSRLFKLNNRFATVPDAVISALLNLNPLQSREQTGNFVQRPGMLSALDSLHDLPDGEARALALIEMICQPKSTVVAPPLLTETA